MSKKRRGKSFVTEFKKFILRGSVIDLAVGIVIGAAFTAIVNSLVNDIIMPVISLVTAGISFNEWFIALDGNTYENLEAATKAGAALLSYGTFISAVLNFLIVSFVIFIVIRFINSVKELGKKEDEAPTLATKKCDFCKSEIDISAVRCPHCTSKLEE
ncbi:MAG: large conductance mechanosensitive channel protein MscL [Clostridiales bacterium]|jgi:large conductance mechanosensitive channel|nr:large conductance mechanosensitive channel protein MscL [Clostridiales bacterium]